MIWVVRSRRIIFAPQAMVYFSSASSTTDARLRLSWLALSTSLRVRSIASFQRRSGSTGTATSTRSSPACSTILQADLSKICPIWRHWWEPMERLGTPGRLIVGIHYHLVRNFPRIFYSSPFLCPFSELQRGWILQKNVIDWKASSIERRHFVLESLTKFLRFRLTVFSVGVPQLMMAFTEDGQLRQSLLDDRDSRCGKSTNEVKAARTHLQPLEPIHADADHWKTGKAMQLTKCKELEFKVRSAKNPSHIQGGHQFDAFRS